MDLPRHKGDVERAEALRRAPLEALESEAPDLLVWLQDMTWPVAGPVEEALAKCGLVLVPLIRAIFESDDDVWKYWMVTSFLRAARPEVRLALRDDVRRLATRPTQAEIREECATEAAALLAEEEVWLGAPSM